MGDSISCFAYEDCVKFICKGTDEEIRSCVEWFLNGWNHDKTADQESNEKIMDFYVDQGRIYADFERHAYESTCNLFKKEVN